MTNSAVLLFLISSARAVVEMLGLCLLAQGVLYLLAGKQRDENPVYRFFALITRGPQQGLARLFSIPPRSFKSGMLLFALLLSLWIGLALLRKFL